MAKQEGLSGEVRLRLPLPLVLPLAALVVIAVLTIGMSRVLLAVPKEAAVVIALAVAVNVLAAAAVLALRPNLSRTALVELAAVVVYPLIIGIAIAQSGIGDEEHAAHEPAAAAPAGPTTAVTASQLQFDTDEIVLTAGEETSLEFQNDDSVQHNIAIYKSESDAQSQKSPLFDGKNITGASTTYDVPKLDPGEYFFQCDVHPSMSGTVTVE